MSLIENRATRILIVFSLAMLFCWEATLFSKCGSSCKTSCKTSCSTTAASCRLSLSSGLSALQVIQIITALQALQGPDGELVLQGLQGIPGLQGIQGIPGPQGFIGIQGIPGPQGIDGVPGTIGLQGIQGPAGTAGMNGVIASAQYVQLGAQPATVAIGQPFTFTTAVLSTPGIIAQTAVFNPPFAASGTVFELVNVGRYEVNFQTAYPEDGGVDIYFGSTIPTMLPLPYTMVGKSPDGAVTGTVIIEVTTPNSFLSINAAAGNAAAITPAANSSTTNQGATTVSFKQIQ